MKKQILIATIIILSTVTMLRAQQVVFIVRHAEEEKGVGDTSDLTEEGKLRSIRLAEILRETGIDAIYTSEAKRTMQTAEPLAKIIRVTPKIAQRNDPAGLVSKLHSEHYTDRVLIVGHRQNIPLLIKELGYSQEVKLGDVHDEMFVVVPQSNGQPIVIRMHFQ